VARSHSSLGPAFKALHDAAAGTFKKHQLALVRPCLAQYDRRITNLAA
jgi:hypothetical protein